jgi:hypothetical protein
MFGGNMRGGSMIEEVAGDLYRVEIPLLGNPLKSINSYIVCMNPMRRFLYQETIF